MSDVQKAFEITPDPGWTLAVEGFDPLRESVFESRFTVSNGFLGMRAARAISRGARWTVPQRTYVAGLFDIPGPEHPIPALIAAADWLQTRIALPCGPLVQHPADVSVHRETLDMRRGVFVTQARLTSPGDAVAVRTMRLVSLSERAIGLHLIEAEIADGELEVTFSASFEGSTLGLKPERLEHDLGVWRTKYSGKRLATCTAASLQIDGQDLPPAKLTQFTSSWSWQTRPGQVVRYLRLVAVARSDTLEIDPGPIAQRKLCAARKRGWRKVLADHEAAWSQRWVCSDIVIDGDPAAQQALRFAIYHLNSAANPDDERVSIGARALTGDDYLGHVFWDTEIYLLPFYTLTWPEAARALLMYRYHTLNGARAKAKAMGWRGAMYAWESADTGAETTPDHVVGPDGRIIDVLCGKQEQHISADIAYAVWQYWQATGDEAFLFDAGAEIILETGRFWSSRAQAEADSYCHIRGVIGPDEYHEHIDDSAFTNVMARWNIRRALDVVALLRERWPDHWAALSSRLGLEDAELEHWRIVAETMATGFDPNTGLYEQFAGYFGLEKIDLTAYAGRTVPMDVVLGRERTQRSQVVKQADVVALLGLLPEEFPGDAAMANFHYYEPRCGHGSSLSAGMHALVAARLGLADMALSYFQQAATIDLGNTDVAIAGGLHIAALGGIWQTVVLGFAGVSLQSEALSLDPKLPPWWETVRFEIQWHGRRLKIEIEPKMRRLRATLEVGEPMTLIVTGTKHQLCRNQAALCTIRAPQPLTERRALAELDDHAG